MMKIAITGADDLLGTHMQIYYGTLQDIQCLSINRTCLVDPVKLDSKFSGADIVLNFAGINRSPDTDIAKSNLGLARPIVELLGRTGASPTGLDGEQILTPVDFMTKA